MRLALDLPEAVAADVGVLRRVNDEPFFREVGAVAVIVAVIDVRINQVLRTTLQPVLSDDNRAALAFRQNPLGSR